MTLYYIHKPMNGQAEVLEDPYQVIQADQAIPDAGQVLVPLKIWQENKADLTARAQNGDLGVWLSPDCNPEELASDANTLKLIAFDFPVFKFGQAYSGAVLLRTRYGYTGEIRAFGDIWRDQLFYLARCGFTQFRIKLGKSVEDAVAAFNDFSIPYQTSADQLPNIFQLRHGT